MQPQNRPTQVIGSTSTYEEAQRIVDYLADHRFPVEQVTIVGAGLNLIEQVTGRRGYLQAATRAALSGAAVGALLGWVFGLFNWVEPLISAVVLAIWGLVIGFVVGAIAGLLAHAATRGRRDFSSVSTVRADRYDVMVASDVADDARQLLAGLRGGLTGASPEQPEPQQPSGQRQ